MDINLLNELNKHTLAEQLEIEFFDSSENQISARMPVNEKTHQPFGYLHGGASLALAETVASSGSYLLADPEKESVFGIQVSSNHVASVKEGNVIATATLIHQGKHTHIWDVIITDDTGKNISLCRVTNKIVEKK
jgi:1,4-dihydroxy-2-naphthoyl-CoA hydrolase